MRFHPLSIRLAQLLSMREQNTVPNAGFAVLTRYDKAAIIGFLY
jgi:hypothetical protein